MANSKIKTYNTQAFRDKFIKPEKQPGEILKPGYDIFFIARVEDMLTLMKLPVPPARATTHSFIYLTEGFAGMNIGSETFTIGADECLFVPAGQVFSFSNPDINKGFFCNFHDEFLVGKSGNKNMLTTFPFLNVWAVPGVKLSKETSACVNQNLSRMMTAYKETGLLYSDLLQLYFLATLHEIKNSYALQSEPGSQPQMLVSRFKELLYTNIRKKHRVADYASLLCVSPNHLNKTVKNRTGKSPTKWIDEVLLLEAKVLLYQTGYTISGIAEEIGMEDPSYFSRFFKKYEKMTPATFRKRIEKS